jgi:hypothetical protein
MRLILLLPMLLGVTACYHKEVERERPASTTVVSPQQPTSSTTVVRP